MGASHVYFASFFDEELLDRINSNEDVTGPMVNAEVAEHLPLIPCIDDIDTALW